MTQLVRCEWAVRHPELIDYHDNVWGHPTHDDREIFAAYAQCVLHAGLLWTAILKKRGIFRAAFDEWDIAKIAAYDGYEMERLMKTEGVIHNFVKLNSVIHNAGKVLEVQQEFGSFSAYLWRFVNNEPILCDHVSSPGAKATRELSIDLKRRGFKFAGEATAFGLMQDIGLIIDHDKSCFCYKLA
jgi:DNA-3-methyladenine glycosylase I